MEFKDIVEIVGLLLTTAISFGFLKGKVSTLSDNVHRNEKRLDKIDDKVNDHSVNMAELTVLMNNVRNTLSDMNEKLDKILTGGK